MVGMVVTRKAHAQDCQEGQNEVDLGGWTIVGGSFAPGKVVSLECTSGLGPFGKLNGKPFVDDLKLAIGRDGDV